MGRGKIAFASFMIRKLRALHSYNEFIMRALVISALYYETRSIHVQTLTRIVEY